MELSSFLPYPSIPQANGVDVQFTITSGVTYEATFAQAEGYFPGYGFANETLMFNLDAVVDVDRTVGLDARIGLTVINIIAGRFKQNPQAVVCYVCDQNDARAFKRAMRFARLFEQGNSEQQLEKADVEVPPLYASILFRRDHPARPEIEQAVQELVSKFLDEEE